MKNSKIANFLMLVLLTSTTTVSIIVYLPTIYYIPFQNTYGLSNGQMGELISIYGILALIGYFFGGILADRFKPKWLLVVSTISTGLLSMFVGTKPDYSLILLVYGAYGFTTIFMQWAAMLKTFRMMAKDDEQEKVFGAFETIASLFSTAVSSIILFMFAKEMEPGGDFTKVMFAYGAVSIAIGLAIAIFFNEKKFIVNENATQDASEKLKLKDIGTALKLPVTWFCSIMVLGLFIITCATAYIAPYLSEAYMLPIAWSAAVGIAIKSVFRFIGAPLGAGIAKKFGRSTKLLYITTIGAIITSIALIILPHGQTLLLLAMVLASGYCLFVNMGRVCMYLPIGEARVPLHIYGTVVGITSVIGYSADIWMYRMFGYFLDNHGVNGYDYIYYIAVGVSIILAVTGFLFDKYLNEIEKESKEKVAI